jgi:hypothetical protein
MRGLAAIFAYHHLTGEIYNSRELRERLQARNPSVLFRFGYRHLALCLARIDNFVHKK